MSDNVQVLGVIIIIKPPLPAVVGDGTKAAAGRVVTVKPKAPSRRGVAILPCAAPIPAMAVLLAGSMARH